MTQSLAKPFSDAARSPIAGRANDREAGNLPRAPVETAFRGARPDGLDWDGFRDLYYPDSRRHDLEAIVAYGAYKESSPVRPQPARVLSSTETPSLEEWEDEGGTAP